MATATQIPAHQDCNTQDSFAGRYTLGGSSSRTTAGSSPALLHIEVKGLLFSRYYLQFSRVPLEFYTEVDREHSRCVPVRDREEARARGEPAVKVPIQIVREPTGDLEHCKVGYVERNTASPANHVEIAIAKVIRVDVGIGGRQTDLPVINQEADVPCVLVLPDLDPHQPAEIVLERRTNLVAEVRSEPCLVGARVCHCAEQRTVDFSEAF